MGTALAAGQAWIGRHAMNSDGVSYLDLSQAYLRRDWRAALNAYWSPLYSWALAAARLVAGRSGLEDFALAHVLNFGIFLAAFACFDRFLLRLIRFTRRQASDRLSAEPLSDWALLVVGYATFLWSSFTLIDLRLVTPDLLLAAFAYLAGSLLLDVRLPETRWPTFAALGIALGFGYLAKAPMFLLSPCYFTMAVLLAKPGHRLRGAGVMVLAFLVVSGPFVLALSRQKGRLTFGDSGRLNYAWFVNGVPHRHWQGDAGKNGVPIHPTRRVLDSPPVYEFRTPIGGTYPFWYDPSYWYEGVRPHFELFGQLAQIARNGRLYWAMFSNIHARSLMHAGNVSLVASPLLLFGLLLCLALGSRPRGLSIRDSWFLLIPSALALVLFSMVHVESRYIAAFAVIGYLAVLAPIRLPAAAVPLLRNAMVLLSFAACALVAVDLWRAHAIPDPSENADSTLGQELQRMGILPGDRIASLNYSNRGASASAHRMEASIVAEIYSAGGTDDEALFWNSDEATRSRVLHAFADAGAVAVLAHNPPPEARDWITAGRTGYSVHLLDPADRAGVRLREEGSQGAQPRK